MKQSIRLSNQLANIVGKDSTEILCWLLDPLQITTISILQPLKDEGLSNDVTLGLSFEVGDI